MLHAIKQGLCGLLVLMLLPTGFKPNQHGGKRGGRGGNIVYAG